MTQEAIPMRFIPENRCSIIDELVEKRDEICDDDMCDSLKDFLRGEVNHLAEITDFPLFTDDDEVRVYTALRARAGVVEEHVYDLMSGRGAYKGTPMPAWRWDLYDPIIRLARTLSVVKATCESSDEDEEEATLLNTSSVDEPVGIVTGNAEPLGMCVEDV